MFFKILPILGLKTNVPVDDPSLIKMIGNNAGLSYDVGGTNITYNRQRNCCTKSLGDDQWSNSAITTPSTPNFMYYFDTFSTKKNYIFRGDEGYVYDTLEDPSEYPLQYITYSNLANGGGDGTIVSGDTVTGDTTSTSATVVCGTTSSSGSLYIKDVTGGTGNFSASESLTFNSSEETADCDSVIQEKDLRPTDAVLYGETVIFSAINSGAHSGMTPFIWTSGDGENFYPLITGTDATLYVFKYINEWYNHIIGLHTSETNGEGSIRWTEALPSGSNLTFPSANQIYKPGNDEITGSAKFGRNLFLVYGRNSICKLDYYPSATPAFGATMLIDNLGIEDQKCLINAYGSHWFFNKSYGFIQYNGSGSINTENIISKDIENIIATIDFSKITQITGKHVRGSRQLVWAITTTQAWPDTLLYFDVDSRTWSREDRTDANIIIMDSWPDDVGTEDVHKLVFSGSSDGHVYYKNGEVLDSVSGTLFDAYRIEPAMYFHDAKRKKFLKSIWFGIDSGDNAYLDVYYRNGNTVYDLETKSWQFIGSLYLRTDGDSVIHMPTMISEVDYDNASDTISFEATITGGTNSYTATVIGNMPTSATAGTLYLQNLTGTLEDDEQITSSEVGNPTADCDGTSSDVVINSVGRYHQIKWGTDLESEMFSINRIEYEYEDQGTY